MTSQTETLRIFQPRPGLFAFYDGRIAGRRLHGLQANWLDDGAFCLGIASYALVAGREALVYDTHITLAHARAIRAHLTGLGVTSIRVVLSHWHDDHIAGNEVFADCEIIALDKTAERMATNRAKLESGTPPISPLILPSRRFSGELELEIGEMQVRLGEYDIHSADGCIAFLPESGILLAGDTVEDCVTYISEAEHTARHIEELARLAALPVTAVYPCHGAPEAIAGDGYSPQIILATADYLRRLGEDVAAGSVEPSLERYLTKDFEDGILSYFQPYEAVHQQNIAALKKSAA